jgi:pimeloyl-ACP methyl ester carboxylesterase
MDSTPRADYSVGGYANGMRDLITLLGIDKVTVVGHSFGGGVAMQLPTSSRSGELMILAPPAGPRSRGQPGAPGGHHPGFHQLMGLLTLPGIRHLGRG